MITKEKLEINLNILNDLIPKKPAVYTSDYPKTIAESLYKYFNQRSLNVLCDNTDYLNKLNWPLPLWVDPNNIKIGIWNTYFWKQWYNSGQVTRKKKFKKFAGFDWLGALVLGDLLSEVKIDWRILKAFDVNLKYFEKQLLNHTLLSDKSLMIKELILVFKEKRYNVCINATFPLIDFIVRKLLKTNNLNISVTKNCKLFKECGFDYDYIIKLMPLIALQDFYKSKEPLTFGEVRATAEYKEFLEKIQQFDFGIVGAALNSFLRFSNNYYSHYSEDNGVTNLINRQAILHGSVNHFGNKINATKLFTYLYLILELKPAFNILFKHVFYTTKNSVNN